MTESNHLFRRPGQVAPDRPAPDRCMECGESEAAHQPRPFNGPFETQDQARALPSVRLTYDLAHDGPPGTIRLRNGKVLVDALIAADVLKLGAYDHQVITWLAQWEPQMIAVICSWITRAYAAGRDGDR